MKHAVNLIITENTYFKIRCLKYYLRTIIEYNLTHYFEFQHIFFLGKNDYNKLIILDILRRSI